MTKAEVIKNYKEAKERLEKEMERYDIYNPRHESGDSIFIKSMSS